VSASARGCRRRARGDGGRLARQTRGEAVGARRRRVAEAIRGAGYARGRPWHRSSLKSDELRLIVLRAARRGAPGLRSPAIRRRVAPSGTSAPLSRAATSSTEGAQRARRSPVSPAVSCYVCYVPIRPPRLSPSGRPASSLVRASTLRRDRRTARGCGRVRNLSRTKFDNSHTAATGRGSCSNRCGCRRGHRTPCLTPLRAASASPTPRSTGGTTRPPQTQNRAAAHVRRTRLGVTDV